LRLEHLDVLILMYSIVGSLCNLLMCTRSCTY
jgi:hypothetical protein